MIDGQTAGLLDWWTDCWTDGQTAVEVEDTVASILVFSNTTTQRRIENHNLTFLRRQRSTLHFLFHPTLPPGEIMSI